MADELDTIVQRIAVEGTGEMGAAFEEVARIGEAAFERISKAAAGAGGIGVMTLGITGLVIAAAAAVYEIGKFAVSEAELGVQTVALAEATGMATGQVKGLGDMFKTAGMNTQQYHRMLEQSVIAMANAGPRIAREQALASSVSQEQDEKIVESKLQVQDAMTSLTFASAEFSQKLQADAIAVGEAWVKLKFESSDLASQAQNDMLSVTGAHIGVQEAEMNLKQLYLQQKTNQYMPKSAVPFEMQSVQEEKNSIARDRAELAVQQAKQRESDAMNKQAKDQALRPYAQERAGLQYDQAVTREAKDQRSTEVERATLNLAKARTAEEKTILEIDIERANSLKAIAADLKEGKVDKFTHPQKVAETIEAESRDRGGGFLDTMRVMAEYFKAAKEARDQKQPGAMSTGTEEAIIRDTHVGGMMRQGSGMSMSKLMQMLEQGPEEVNKWAASRPDITEDQKVSNQAVVDASHEFGVGVDKFKEAVGSFVAAVATGQGNKPGSANYVPPTSAGMAGGGLVVGPGTGTSDSINARLSHGEHVTKAAAVKFWGTDFMDAINNMILPGFAEGGIFGGGVSLPGSFEPSGMGPGGMGTVNLHLDGRSFEGLLAPNAVMRELSHYAIGRQTSATGRKPSWVR